MKTHTRLQLLNQYPLDLQASDPTPKTSKEFRIANISIWSVTLLLCALNVIDLMVIFTGQLPEGMSYSSYVHQGFYTLIFTITLAIILVMIFFRNQLNFHKNIDKIRIASYAWIAQNILLAFISGYKNLLYVEVYGLTYKRIAVFLCLICTLIGLLLLYRKVHRPSTNWFYFNQVGLYAFVCSVGIALVPFDKLITHYNLHFSQTQDLDYILSLEYPDYIELMDYAKKHLQENNTSYTLIQKQVESLHFKHKKAAWQSWNYYSHHQTKMLVKHDK